MAHSAVLGVARMPRRVAWDATFVGLSIAHAGLLLAFPSIPLVAIALWWNANTIGHNFIHRPFFPSRRLNRIYSAYLSLVLGLPQRLWRSRHLSHHAGVRHRVRWTTPLLIEIVLVLGLWAVLAVAAPRVFLTVYLPGWAIGLALCQVHGYYEHAHGTKSYYGRLYNLLLFNDGFHVEHHRRPVDHWTALSAAERVDARPSQWPPVLRWLEDRSPARAFLTGLERLVLRSPLLQRFVLRTHERAFHRLLSQVSAPQRVTVVGGGLFPRTALVLQRVMPEAHVTIVDAQPEHLAVARRFVGSSATLAHATFDAAATCDADLLVVPLAFEGDRRLVYDRPPARVVLVHDWLWSPRGRSVVISWLLLKRLNLIER
jgi:hypothetical protein